MKIILTGATGLVGRRALSIGIQRSYHLISFGRSRPIGVSSIDHTNEISTLCSDADLLLHCASATPFNSDISKCIQYNHEIDKMIIDIIRSRRPNHVVYLSSMAVYGQVCSTTVDENYKPINPNPYGMSKLQGERLLQDTCSIELIPLTILRLPGVVDIGMHDIFMKKCYDSLYSGSEVFVRSLESQFNNSILADDVFKIALDAVNTKVLGILNLHSKDTISMKDLFSTFEKVTGNKLNVSERKDCNPPFVIANSNHSLNSTRSIHDIIATYHERVRGGEHNGL